MIEQRPARVRARGWGWRHGSRAAPAVSGLDLDIAPGERVLLLGPTGSGKSTLLAGLAGVLGGDEEGEDAGELTVGGVDPATARGTVGLVLQDPDSQTVLARLGDEVAFGCENLGVPADEIWPRVRDALAAVGLDLPLDRSTAELSGGQKQRLALASVLAMRPGLLLLDEPTAHLDPSGVREVRDAVAHVVEDRTTTLVVVEHRVATWIDLVDRVVVLGADGRLLADGSPDEVLDRHGEELAARGVWVPGRPPRVPIRHRATATETLEVADDLTIGRFRFGERDPAVVAGPLSVRVDGGRALALTGPNGAGKSTLALTLAGLLPPVAGDLRATETLAAGARPEPIRWRSRHLVRRIGTVFQDPEHQFLRATVRAELEVGPRMLRRHPADIASCTDELLERLRLAHLAEANPFTLSGGENRRLSVATAIATTPRLIVVDEPTFGQDSVTWSELVALLDRLVAEGAGLVAVSHDAEFVAAIADASLELVPRSVERAA